MMSAGRWSDTVLVLAAVFCAASLPADEPSVEAKDIVQVNGRSVTHDDLELAYLVRGIPPDRRQSLRNTLLERLIDERLIAIFLEQRRIKPGNVSIETQVEQIKSLIRRRGEEPDELLAKLGLNETMLREQLSLPLAWEAYAREVITPDQLRSYFDGHHRELDGTQLRARHIVLKVPADAPDEAWTRAASRLDELRRQIQSGRLSFAEACRDNSEGPSRQSEGDVGFFAHRGTMPAAFADAAFQPKRGEISQPVRTNAGMHLIEVTDERPGQLSLEDVRETVFERLAEQLWNEQVARERAQAMIVWTEAAEPQPKE